MSRRQLLPCLLLALVYSTTGCADAVTPPESTPPAVVDQTPEVDGKADRPCLDESCEPAPTQIARCGNPIDMDWADAPTDACALQIRDTLTAAADFDPVVSFAWEERCETLTEPTYRTAVGAFEDFIEQTEGWDRFTDRVGGPNDEVSFELSPIRHANGGSTVTLNARGAGIDTAEVTFVFGAEEQLLMKHGYRPQVLGPQSVDMQFRCAEGAEVTLPDNSCTEALAKMQNLVSDLSGAGEFPIGERAALPALVASSMYEFARAEGLSDDDVVDITYEGDASQMRVELAANGRHARHFAARTRSKGGFLAFDGERLSCAPLLEDRVGNHGESSLDFSKKLAPGEMIATKVDLVQDTSDAIDAIGIALTDAAPAANMQLGLYRRSGEEAYQIGRTDWVSATSGRQEISLGSAVSSEPDAEYWITLVADDEVTLGMDRWSAHRVVSDVGTSGMPEVITPDTENYDSGGLRAWIVLK